MITALRRLSLAILLAATLGPGEAGAGTQMNGTLGCGFDNCVDIYMFTCSDSRTRYVELHACDPGPTYDDRMTLTAWRKTSGPSDGKGDIDSVQLANACAAVRLSRSSPGLVSGLATVSAPGNLFPFEYFLSVFCLDKDLLELPNPGVTPVTNQ